MESRTFEIAGLAALGRNHLVNSRRVPFAAPAGIAVRSENTLDS
jgi:hypothetical protein